VPRVLNPAKNAKAETDAFASVSAFGIAAFIIGFPLPAGQGNQPSCVSRLKAKVCPGVNGGVTNSRVEQVCDVWALPFCQELLDLAFQALAPFLVIHADHANDTVAVNDDRLWYAIDGICIESVQGVFFG
jgi:hypothetical protein